MGQSWLILNLDTQEICPNLDADPARLVKYLTHPVFVLPQTSDGCVTSPSACHPYGLLERLPVEMIAAVSVHLQFHDVLRLSLVCRALWTKLAHRIQGVMRYAAAPWAGHRIITLGECLHDPPDHLLTPEDADRQVNYGIGDSYPNFPANLYHYAEGTYQTIEFDSTIPISQWNLEPSDEQLLTRLLAPYPYYPGHPNGYILRNLTKHQYVRGGALQALIPEEIVSHGPFLEPIGFGDLILLMTLWSDHDPDADDNRWSPSFHGEWAGDRFDIVWAEGVDLHGWTDCSSQAAKVLEQLVAEKVKQADCDYYRQTCISLDSAWNPYV